ncbi:flagellar basal body-associated protein FliL [Exilibacterium tricleocarpae]|uniref:Flagellar protein FliL n=1 Tax=Exilibacterium tricleocarpae TaxID=2591008 RepID=A0A545U3X0_9GAMM|nr:flagellar basal body-associated FliL family protein [Exilibacterium tricleocarpae]TQV84181.1 flagellar basal body-associated protein FliL [Exilibacterium tricleocarpae]
MAEEDDQAQDDEKPSGGKKKVIVLAVVGLVLIGLSVGGTLLALQMLAPEPVAAEDGAAAEPAAPVKLPAVYFPLKPPIVVNFQARGRQRFLQVEVTLMARENEVVEAIELHMPMIRNSLVLLLGGQVYEDLQTAEGKELLRQQALEELQGLLQQEIDQPGIEQVLFTNFVMQ